MIDTNKSDISPATFRSNVPKFQPNSCSGLGDEASGHWHGAPNAKIVKILWVSFVFTKEYLTAPYKNFSQIKEGD